MTISPERLANAKCAYGTLDHSRDTLETMLERILSTDDAFRAISEHSAPRSEHKDEPKLVAWMVYDGSTYRHRTGGDKVKLENCSPAALRSMADHMEWKSRPAPAPAVEVTDDVLDKAIDKFDEYDSKWEAMKQAINYALRATASKPTESK